MRKSEESDLVRSLLGGLAVFALANFPGRKKLSHGDPIPGE